jgi:AraC-like DNA-binding protein
MGFDSDRARNGSSSMDSTQRWSLDQRIYAPYKIATLAQTAAESGLAADVVLAGTGLKAAQLRDPLMKTSVRQLVVACRNVLRAGAPAGTALQVGSRMHISSYGMYGYALLCCETLRDVTQLAVKYHRLATPTVGMSFREDDGDAVWSFDQIVDLEIDDPLYRFFVEFQFGIHITLGKDLMGPVFKVSRVRARYPAPADRTAYRQHLRCKAEFDQPVNELRFAAALLDEHPTYRNPITVAMVSEVCERLLEEARRGEGVGAQVSRLLMAVPGRFDDMETIAHRLNTTSRTLRRRLHLEGTSYQDILAEVRCNLAKEYLRTTRMTTEDIAETLGFSDAANFRHAFRRWTGKNPSNFRR